MSLTYVPSRSCGVQALSSTHTSRQKLVLLWLLLEVLLRLLLVELLLVLVLLLDSQESQSLNSSIAASGVTFNVVGPTRS
jgi:hypothetical protein